METSIRRIQLRHEHRAATPRKSENRRRIPVTKHSKTIDLRPFQSKADWQREDELKAHYRRIAIPEVVAAVQQRADRPAKNANEQMH